MEQWKIEQISLAGYSFRVENDEFVFIGDTPIQSELDAIFAEYDTNQPLKLLREEGDKKLKEEVDSKTCEAYNNGTQLSTEWKNYRQALLDMTLQTPTLDENGNLKAGLELDEIYWPTKPE